MTTTSPWAPQTGVPQELADRPLPAPPPVGGPPPQPPIMPPPSAPAASPRRQAGLLVAILAMAAVMVVAVAATAAITYALTRNNSEPPQPSAIAPSAPQFSEAQRAEATRKLCGVFDVTARGQKGQGGVVENGQVNLPVVVRTVNSVVAIQNTLTPALPEEFAQTARTYVDSSLSLTAAATGNANIDEVNRLTSASNDATYALVDACGLR